MEITLENLVKMCSDCYDASLYEDSDDFIDKILEANGIKDDSDGFKIYTVEELRMMQQGTVFVFENTPALGEAVVAISSSGEKHVRFSNKLVEAVFAYDGYPWDIPIKVIYTPNSIEF